VLSWVFCYRVKKTSRRIFRRRSVCLISHKVEKFRWMIWKLSLLNWKMTERSKSWRKW
jgi:hypothetical protein